MSLSAGGGFARVSALVCTLLACGAHAAASVRAEPDSTTWYVSAAAPIGGDGTRDAPFGSLAAVETASRAGDTIMVRAVAPDIAPLDGGIALKPGQRLRGEGPAVIGAPAGTALPRITNTTAANDGDAVRLAERTEVGNLVIAGAQRGGVYGHDAVDTVITGNDVSQTNRSCVDGFLIGPFTLPPGLPFGVALPPAPDFITLDNGWAAIMTDFTAGAGFTRIAGNSVHDTACGDGIDVRAHGTSRVHAEVTGNDLRTINLGPANLSVLALGVQAGDSAQLTATLNGNAQSEIASPASSLLNKIADSEGVFINAEGRARMDVTIDDNRFRDGYGNFSANGLEYVSTNGSPVSRVRVTDSSFENVTGDIIENYNLSTEGAQQSLTLENVRAHHSEFPAAVLNSLIPANLGTCLVTTNFGRDARTELHVTDSSFGGCSADGIGLIAYTPAGGVPATSALTFDIGGTVIEGAAAHGINIINVGDTAVLRGTVARTSVSGANGSLIRVDSNGVIAGAALEFGAGELDGSARSCLAEPHPRVRVSGIAVTCGS
ncbi:hypothetical protein ABZ319_13025 [Nocardia sp. NPDC005978]|uniref:hypothetical protein n=1 Tax=Nocardia sp. NPDC005978 TaxID=3156725 RepID=UPI00339F0101